MPESFIELILARSPSLPGTLLSSKVLSTYETSSIDILPSHNFFKFFHNFGMLGLLKTLGAFLTGNI